MVQYFVGGACVVFALLVLDKIFEDSSEPTSTVVLTTG